jgi:transposase
VVRWNMVEVAHAAVRVRDSRFRALFLRVMAKKGKKTAYVAVARKMLTVIWHLLVNGEKYVEDGFQKKFRVKVKLLMVVMFRWRQWLRF